MYMNDCSDNCIRKCQQYFLDKGFIIKSISKIEGLRNKEFGDLQIDLLKDDIEKTVYIDYKCQTRDRWFIPIELVQVNVKGEYSSWLYENNIDFIVYEFKNGAVYLFEHSELLRIAKQNNIDDMWDTCLVYSKSPNNYTNERKYIDDKLNSYRVIKNNIIAAEHINGCFNYKYDGSKVHSGFCLNLSLDTVEQYKI